MGARRDRDEISGGVTSHLQRKLDLETMLLESRERDANESPYDPEELPERSADGGAAVD